MMLIRIIWIILKDYQRDIHEVKDPTKKSRTFSLSLDRFLWTHSYFTSVFVDPELCWCCTYTACHAACWKRGRSWEGKQKRGSIVRRIGVRFAKITASIGIQDTKNSLSTNNYSLIFESSFFAKYFKNCLTFGNRALKKTKKEILGALRIRAGRLKKKWYWSWVCSVRNFA